MPLQGDALRRALRQLENGNESESESVSDSDSDSPEGSQETNVNANPPTRKRITKRKAKSPPETSFKYVEPLKIRRYLENGRNPILTSDDDIIDDSSCDALSSEGGKNVITVNRDLRGRNYESLSCISGEENDELEGILRKNNNAKQEDFCFFCENMYQKDVIDTEPIQKLCRAFEDHGHMDNFKLAKLIHNLYKELIYIPHQHTTTPIPMWRTKTILAHIEEHTEEPKNYVVESIKKYKNLGKTLNKMVFQIDEISGVPLANTKIIKTQIDIDKMICQLYAQKLPTMNFFSHKISTKTPR